MTFMTLRSPCHLAPGTYSEIRYLLDAMEKSGSDAQRTCHLYAPTAMAKSEIRHETRAGGLWLKNGSELILHLKAAYPFIIGGLGVGGIVFGLSKQTRVSARARGGATPIARQMFRFPLHVALQVHHAAIKWPFTVINRLLPGSDWDTSATPPRVKS